MTGRALGIDYGSRRTGVAVSDALGIAATAIEQIEERDPERVAQRVAALARERGVAVLVFGLPVHMSGDEHGGAAGVRRVAERCAELTGLAVEFVDERLTTMQAERHLREAGLTRKGRKQRVDKVAAALLLQGWLDSRR